PCLFFLVNMILLRTLSRTLCTRSSLGGFVGAKQSIRHLACMAQIQNRFSHSSAFRARSESTAAQVSNPCRKYIYDTLDRSFIHISGSETCDFLQGIYLNDIAAIY